tara:strand:- start:895 stop:1218 length:324 start_codon:yes stop_codon:yes gene_type:complete
LLAAETYLTDGTGPSGSDVKIYISKIPQLKYPRKALRLGVEGFVKLGFDVSENGDLVDLRVVDAKPRALFDKSAMQFMGGMKFLSPKEEGDSVRARDAEFTVKFQLN